VSVAIAFLTYAVILPAELPDKSLLATVVLGTRHRAPLVLLGVGTAFAVHVVIAVAAGGLLTLLPHRVLELVVAVVFTGAAVVLFRGEADEEVPVGTPPASGRRIFALSFTVVFVGEWGDITQIATANLAARYNDPYAVGIGSLLALISASALAVVAGRQLTRRISLDTVRRGAGVLMTVLAVLAFLSLLNG
jgi:putative Ca2+/H+ antiporter (TMEM165/GDT1 family)